MKYSLSQYVIVVSFLLLGGGIEAGAQTHTPAVPPRPDCNVRLKGDGKWVKGDIIHGSSPIMGSSCTQIYSCTGNPSKKPNEACRFTLKHTETRRCLGKCDGPSCNNCADPPKVKCESVSSPSKQIP